MSAMPSNVEQEAKGKPGKLILPLFEILIFCSSWIIGVNFNF
jgi:hypothetical protein